MLENNRLKLRAVEPEDLDHFFRWENDTSLWENNVSFAPYSRFQLKKYIETSTSNIYDDKQLRLMMELKDGRRTVVGCIDLFDFDAHNQRVSWGILVDEAHRRKGFAEQALALLADYCFRVLQVRQLHCQVSAGNAPCLRMLGKIGFERTGTLRRWAKTPGGFVDVAVFQLFNPFS